MTHVLNYALRKTLGGEVDQKGSLVSDEKFRFDFSFNRAVNSDELSAIEGIVSEATTAWLAASAVTARATMIACDAGGESA